MAARLTQLTVIAAEAGAAAQVRLTEMNVQQVQQNFGTVQARFTQLTVIAINSPASGGGFRLMGIGS